MSDGLRQFQTKDEPLIEFPGGAKRSDRRGKGRFDLISPIFLRRLAGVYERGAEQKGDNNWLGGFPISRCLDSAMRHINQYREGDRSEDHLAQAAWQLACAVTFEEKYADDTTINDLPDYRPIRGASGM